VTILYLLIPLGLLLLAIAVAAFFWATRSGQFDDLDSPGWSVVLDDDRAPGNRQRRDRDTPDAARSDRDAGESRE
jgi:cbb3-type cytochrome oxidase maturation protein